MKKLNEAAQLMGRASYRARLKRLGLKRIQEIARQNGRKGGRPPKDATAKGKRYDLPAGKVQR